MKPLQDRVVIVTGAGHEIGRNHVIALAAAGARVIANEPVGKHWSPGARRRLEETASQVSEGREDLILAECDVATREGAQALWQTAIDAFGTVHCLVNSAGETRDRTLAKMSSDEWAASVDTCLGSSFHCSAVSARYWRELASSGKPVKSVILNRSSTSSMPGQPGQANYAAAMSGVATLTIVAAREGAQYGMRANCLCGPMDAAALRRASKMRDDKGIPGAGTDWHVDASVLSPVAVALLKEDCPISGQVMFVSPDRIRVLDAWPTLSEAMHGGTRSPAEMGEHLSHLKLRENDW